MPNEGFWSSKKVPVPNTINPIIKKQFLEKLDKVEKFINVLNPYPPTNVKKPKIFQEWYINHYKGLSWCRICNKNNGASEYKTNKWRWPQGYRHYIIDHNTKPSEKFYKYIMDLDLGQGLFKDTKTSTRKRIRKRASTITRKRKRSAKKVHNS